MTLFFFHNLADVEVKEKEEDRRGEEESKVERRGGGGKGPIISRGGPPELKTAICSQIDLSTPA